MTENNESSTIEPSKQGKLLRVEAGAVVREGILAVPEGSQGLVLLTNENETTHDQTVYLAQAFYLNGLASLIVDLFNAEELQLDAQSGYFRNNTSIMEQRIVGIAEWLHDQAGTKHLSIGYIGSGVLGAAALIAAEERPDIVAAVVAGGAELASAKTFLPGIMAPTLLLAAEQDRQAQEIQQQLLGQLSVPKETALVPGMGTLADNLEEVARLASAWFTRHLVSVM